MFATGDWTPTAPKIPCSLRLADNQHTACQLAAVKDPHTFEGLRVNVSNVHHTPLLPTLRQRCNYHCALIDLLVCVEKVEAQAVNAQLFDGQVAEDEETAICAILSARRCRAIHGDAMEPLPLFVTSFNR